MAGNSTVWFDCSACSAPAAHHCDLCGNPEINPEQHFPDDLRGCPPHLYVADGTPPWWESVCHACQTPNRVAS
jgi:hypothetical protein